MSSEVFMDYQDLKARAEELKENQNAKARQNYHYARKLGFSSREAMLLMSKPIEEIDRIAKERDEAGGNGK
jgi:hypothetical protein